MKPIFDMILIPCTATKDANAKYSQSNVHGLLLVINLLKDTEMQIINNLYMHKMILKEKINTLHCSSHTQLFITKVNLN